MVDKYNMVYRLSLILVIVVLLVIVCWMQARAVEANRIGRARTRIADFKTALDSFSIGAGRYPTSAEGLRALLEKPAGHAPDRLQPRIPESVLKDPWGRDYLYRYPGQHGRDGYDLSSAGPDGTPGTSDDITNW